MVRKITPAGVVTTLAGTGAAGSANGTGTNASFYNPRGVAIDTRGGVIVADYSNHLIRKITSEGVVSTLAGSGARQVVNGTATLAGVFADGTGTLVGFYNPADIALDGNGNLFVVDAGNNRIRKITPIY
jgi:hypothetical protein